MPFVHSPLAVVHLGNRFSECEEYPHYHIAPSSFHPDVGPFEGAPKKVCHVLRDTFSLPTLVHRWTASTPSGAQSGG